jgi:hypothetical protein
MINCSLIPGIILFSLCLAQGQSTSLFKLALTAHKGQLAWSADGFKIIQTSAKAEGKEIGVRAQNATSKLSFLGFLFLVDGAKDLTSNTCRDGALAQMKKSNQGIDVLSSTEAVKSGRTPVSLVSYTSSAGYSVRGFVAAGDLCGDLEVYSKQPISADDPAVQQIFSTYELDKGYTPQFADVVFYAQVLFQTKMYRAAAPIFEKAMAMVPADGKPFASAKLARRIVTDQAGISYGMDGELANSKAIFESAIAADPEYPMYYYNLACADAAEKNLNAARVHLKQAFDRKMNMNPGETLPNPTKDDSFLPYANRKDFWDFVSNLASK